jgi:hypothetical protein
VTVAGTSPERERIASTRATASSSVAVPFSRLNDSVAPKVTFTRSSPLAANRSHPRSFRTSPEYSVPARRSIAATTASAPAICGTRVVAHEADRLDPRQSCSSKPVHELGPH